MKYAGIEDVEAGFRTLTQAEREQCDTMLEEAAVIIDAFNAEAKEERKKLVSCRMVRRQLGTGDRSAITYPTGASQGSASALGYTQSWTMAGGSVGEMYLSKLEKQLLGAGNRIGASNPLQAVCP